METIYDLMRRAVSLRGRTETGSIGPEEVGGLHQDTLEYIAGMERNADGLGIRNTYPDTAAMEADAEAPTGTDGKPLRFGQLVAIHDPDSPFAASDGDVYAWQKPGWKLVGRLSGSVRSVDVSELDAMIEDPAATPESISRIAGTWTLTASMTAAGRRLPAGVVAVFTDGMKHQLTQVVVSNCVLADDGTLGAGHMDRRVFAYRR